ncbi:MAG: saccharopine dehydrogenase NADP-binding domain-containing protein [Burkholderiaceae bacterium]
MHTILVLGGYGFFGTRICRSLATDPNIRLLIAGRDGSKAIALAKDLGLSPNQAMTLDATDPLLTGKLAEAKADTVIHTAGPFQGQDYAVARESIAANANYIDLADGRDFVSGIEQLDAAAKERNVLVTSGASSLPALSSAVVDRYRCRFQVISTIRHGIGSGARAPGLATMRGVFGYVGKRFSRLENGNWTTTWGWQDTRIYPFPAPVGRRFLGSCDVPDLVLFPRRYEGVRTVTFHAGFASAPGHLLVLLASMTVRLGLVSSMVPLAPALHAVSKWLEPLTSDRGGMFVSLEGIGKDGKPHKLTWHILAANNHGPYIPCGASIALAKALARSDSLPSGAYPCMGLITVEEYLAALDGYDVTEVPA